MWGNGLRRLLRAVMSFAECCVSGGPQDPEGQRAGHNTQTDWVHENEPVETPAPPWRRACNRRRLGHTDRRVGEETR